MFRMNGYVQDERYTAGAGSAGAVRFSFAQCLSQEAHDCRDAGGRATQEQLPRSGAFQFCTVFGS